MSTATAPASTATAAPPPPSRRLSLRAVVIGIALVVAALAPIVIDQLTSRPEMRLVDLDVYRSAGQSVLSGQPVYDYLTPPPQLLPFTYPPVSAVLAIPLAMLPWLAVQWIWTIAQLVVLVWIAAVAFRPAVARFGSNWPIALGLLVAGAGWLVPIRDGIRFGQVDIFLVGLCLADCVTRRPKWPRGALIGVAAAVKLTPAVFIPYLWLTGRRRAAAVATATAAALTLATFVLLPNDSVDYWGDALFASDRLGTNNNTSNQSLRGLLLRTPLDGLALTAALAVCLVVVAVVGYRRARLLSSAGDEVAGVAMVGLLAVLLSPVAWIHHLAWVVLVIGVLAGDLRDRRRLGAALAVGIFYGLQIPWYGQHLLHAHVPLVFAIPLQDGFGLVAVVLVATLPARRLPRSDRGAHVMGTPVAPIPAS